jgi:hypothetical protein
METAIDNIIREIETTTKFRCPNENRKNMYLKACWLLSIHQSADKYSRGSNEGITSFIQQLKTLLPDLRKRVYKEK